LAVVGGVDGQPGIYLFWRGSDIPGRELLLLARKLLFIKCSLFFSPHIDFQLQIYTDAAFLLSANH
jgi:hypothetical protein